MEGQRLLQLFVTKAEADPRLLARVGLSDQAFEGKWSYFIDFLFRLSEFNPPLNESQWEQEYELAIQRIFYDPVLNSSRSRFWDPAFVAWYNDRTSEVPSTEERDRYLETVRTRQGHIQRPPPNPQRDNQQRYYDRNYRDNMTDQEEDYLSQMAYRQYNPNLPREVVFNRSELSPAPRGFIWLQYATDGTGRKFFVLTPQPNTQYAAAA